MSKVMPSVDVLKCVCRSVDAYQRCLCLSGWADSVHVSVTVIAETDRQTTRETDAQTYRQTDMHTHVQASTSMHAHVYMQRVLSAGDTMKPI